MNIIEAIEDEHLFAPWFKDHRSWTAWFVFLKALFNIRTSNDEFKLFAQHTAREKALEGDIHEAWLIVGRRGGKSFIVSLIAVYLACFRDYSPYLSPGERGHVMILACDRKQARVIMRYITAFFENIPMLSKLVEHKGKESIELTNRINIEVHTTSFRAVRGYTVVAALCDEIAYWRSDESANPDSEIITALKPAMATIPNSLLIGLSSPYAKRGVLYEAYRDRHENVLVWQADTLSMNPSVDPKVIQDAYERDPVSAAAEYGAQFRNDFSSYLDHETVEAVVARNLHIIPYSTNYHYRAFTDASGGRRDSWPLVVSHSDENGMVIIDCIVEHKPPFSPEAVVKNLCKVLKEYHITTVTGDRYAGEFPVELFNKNNIGYQVSELNRSELYLELLPQITSGRVQLLDHKKMITQLALLERRTARSGKDSIDHPTGSHDDIANCIAGAVYLTKGMISVGEPYLGGTSAFTEEPFFYI